MWSILNYTFLCFYYTWVGGLNTWLDIQNEKNSVLTAAAFQRWIVWRFFLLPWFHFAIFRLENCVHLRWLSFFFFWAALRDKGNLHQRKDEWAGAEYNYYCHTCSVSTCCFVSAMRVKNNKNREMCEFSFFFLKFCNWKMLGIIPPISRFPQGGLALGTISCECLQYLSPDFQHCSPGLSFLTGREWNVLNTKLELGDFDLTA